MTTPLVNAALVASPVVEQPPRATPRARAPRGPGWLREPLLHFVLLGGLLFALDHCLVARRDDPRTIVVSVAADREAIETFKAARGHEPNAEELAALRRVWLDNEVLYREGLALGVDKGDTAIRERVIFKALSVVDSNVKPSVPSNDLLRAWFESHRDKYDEPARFDFDEAVLSGRAAEAEVRAFVNDLNAGTPGDAKAGLRVFKARPEPTLAASYGAEFARALPQSPLGVWRAFDTQGGWRALKLNAITPAKRATFAEYRNVVLQDFSDAAAAQQRTDAVRALTQKYRVKYESAQ
jgi:hypothetical protein